MDTEIIKHVWLEKWKTLPNSDLMMTVEASTDAEKMVYELTR